MDRVGKNQRYLEPWKRADRARVFSRDTHEPDVSIGVERHQNTCDLNVLVAGVSAALCWLGDKMEN